jgi:hypothetical protein
MKDDVLAFRCSFGDNENKKGLKWTVKVGYYATMELAGISDNIVSSFRQSSL